MENLSNEFDSKATQELRYSIHIYYQAKAMFVEIFQMKIQ